MHFTSALITLALAAASSVSAAAFNSQQAVQVLTPGVTPTNFSAVTDLTVSVAALNSVFGYVKYFGTTSSSPYTFAASLNGSTASTQIASAASTAPQFQTGELYCPVCLPSANYTLTSGSYSYTYSFIPMNATAASAQSINFNNTVIADINVALINATALTLNTPSTDDQNRQPGKLLYFTIPINSSAAGNTTNGTIVFSSTEGIIPFTSVSVVGGGLCPKVNASDNVTRQVTSLSTWTTNLAGNVTIANLTTGTYWVYLAPSASVRNTLTTASTATLYYDVYGNTTCTAGTNGFCSGAATLKSVVGVAFAGAMAAAFFLF